MSGTMTSTDAGTYQLAAVAALGVLIVFGVGGNEYLPQFKRLPALAKALIPAWAKAAWNRYTYRPRHPQPRTRIALPASPFTAPYGLLAIAGPVTLRQYDRLHENVLTHTPDSPAA